MERVEEMAASAPLSSAPAVFKVHADRAARTDGANSQSAAGVGRIEDEIEEDLDKWSGATRMSAVPDPPRCPPSCA